MSLRGRACGTRGCSPGSGARRGSVAHRKGIRRPAARWVRELHWGEGAGTVEHDGDGELTRGMRPSRNEPARRGSGSRRPGNGGLLEFRNRYASRYIRGWRAAGPGLASPQPQVLLGDELRAHERAGGPEKCSCGLLHRRRPSHRLVVRHPLLQAGVEDAHQPVGHRPLCLSMRLLPGAQRVVVGSRPR